MIASLPMYERPENREAHDRLWDLIRTACDPRLPGAPTGLTRAADPWRLWQAPDLFLSQTCSLPYRTRLHEAVTLAGAADFGLPGPPGHYTSVFVVRKDDPRTTLADFTGAPSAVNDALSQSGWCAPQAHLARHGLPAWTHVTVTGAHRRSAEAVARGEADIAAIDAVTWRLVERWDGFADALRVIDETAPSPGLPYITAPGIDAPALGAALGDAIDRLDAADRLALGGIRGFVAIPADAYMALASAPALP